jgi:hypothetical protein
LFNRREVFLKVNPSQTRSLERVLDQHLGTGTSILSEGGAVKLIPGENDQIQISQLGNRLQILVNGSDKFLLTERESQNFDIQGDQKNITFDPSVSLFSKAGNVTAAAESLPGIPAEHGNKLGQARRVESSFGTAATRGMITGELKEDVYIGHIGKQLQRFLGEIEGTPLQQTSFRTENDLLPFLKRIDSITSNDPTIKIPTLQKIQEEINTGAPVNLEFLGSQITRGLKQIIASKTSPSIEVQAGKIPFEEREIPVGESHRSAFQKWGIINEAIAKNDIPTIGEIASDPSFLKMALPAEKSAFINALSKQTISPENLQNVVQILQSSRDATEFKNILNTAGVKTVQDIFKENPVEFNITAHVLKSSEFAFDSGPPSFITNKYLQGFSPHQIFLGRQEIFSTESENPFGFSESIAKFSQNPLLLAITSPAEKASFIKELQTGYLSTADNRSIINILQSTMNKDEFDQIVNAAGGKSIVQVLQDPVSLLQWNRLAGGYGREDLTTDFVEGIKFSGALLEPFPFEGQEPVSFLPVKAPTILRDQPAGEIAAVLGAFMKDAGEWIGNQINVLERGTYVQAGLENLNRMMEEAPLFDISFMRNQLHSLLQKSDIQPQHIMNYFQHSASAAGLSAFDLGNMIARPLAFLYQVAANEAGTLAGNALAFLKENLQLNLFQYGPKSSQSKQVEGQIEWAQKTFLPFTERLQSISNLLSELFPPPPDFIQSVSKFTHFFHKNVTPILSSLIPNFADVTAAAAPAISKADGSPLRSYVANVFQGLEAIRSGHLAREISRVGQELSRISEMPRDLIQFTRQASSFLSSIQDGSYAKTLKEVVAILNEHDDPIADVTKATAQNGAKFLEQIHDGSFIQTHDQFLRELNNFQNSPDVVRLNESFKKLSLLTDRNIQRDLSDEAMGLIPEIAGNGLRGTLTNIVRAAAIFRQSPAFRKMIDLVEGGGKFLTALSQGNFAQSMELMNSRFGYSPAVAQIIERGLHLTTTGTNVLKPLVVRDFERPIVQLTRKAQAKTQAAKEIADAENVFAAATTTFFALTELDNMDPLWQYHRQLDLLNESVRSDSSLRQFERQIQLLAAEPDLKNSLQKQFSAFQKAHSK